MRHTTFAALMLAVACTAATPATRPTRFTLKPNAPVQVVSWWQHQDAIRAELKDFDETFIGIWQKMLISYQNPALSEKTRVQLTAAANKSIADCRARIAALPNQDIVYAGNAAHNDIYQTRAEKLVVVKVVDKATMIVKDGYSLTWALTGYSSDEKADGDIIDTNLPLWQHGTLQVEGKTYHVREVYDPMKYLERVP